MSNLYLSTSINGEGMTDHGTTEHGALELFDYELLFVLGFLTLATLGGRSLSMQGSDGRFSTIKLAILNLF